jgi:hypothetical protein
VSVIDAAPNETRAGAWTTYARMNLLCTPKSLAGPEAGFPGLGFQAWHEARFGEASYADIQHRVETARKIILGNGVAGGCGANSVGGREIVYV